MTVEFNRGAIRPVECLKAGNELIKGQFWLFLGIVLVGLMIAAAVPFGVLMGPMLCGIHYAFFRKMRGERVEFGDLFKGFDNFGPAAIASILQTAPIIVLAVLGYIPIIGMVVAMSNQQRGQAPDPALMWGMMGAISLFVLVIMIGAILLQLVFMFAYPLILEHKLPAMDAIKLSARASFANLGGMIGLLLLGTLLSFVGLLACYFGVFLVMPIIYAANSVAYRRVFPTQAEPVVVATPPPPPTW